MTQKQAFNEIEQQLDNETAFISNASKIHFLKLHQQPLSYSKIRYYPSTHHENNIVSPSVQYSQISAWNESFYKTRNPNKTRKETRMMKRLHSQTPNCICPSIPKYCSQSPVLARSQRISRRDRHASKSDQSNLQYSRQKDKEKRSAQDKILDKIKILQKMGKPTKSQLSNQSETYYQYPYYYLKSSVPKQDLLLSTTKILKRKSKKINELRITNILPNKPNTIKFKYKQASSSPRYKKLIIL